MINFAHTLKLTSLAAATILLTACGGSSNNNSQTPPQNTTPPPVSNEVDYQALIEQRISDIVPGIVLYIDSPDKQFWGSAGVSNLDTQAPMPVDAVIPNGSSGKKATALLANMLYEEGYIDFDVPISTYLSQEVLSHIQYSEQITLRMLLTHTSGVYDYLEGDAFFEAVLEDQLTLKTDSYALKFAYDMPAYNEPGEEFHYSNSGYLLVGLILDSVLGEHHSAEMRKRIFEPFGFTSMHYGAVEREQYDTASGYLLYDGVMVDTKAFYERIGVADAPLVANVEDIANLLKVIVTDDPMISEESHARLRGDGDHIKISEGFYAGMGIFKQNIGGHTVYHHGGEEAGYSTLSLYIPESDTSITAFLTCGAQTQCEVEVNSFLNQLYEIEFDK
ncbi:serine hydrolase domain-containing protein [Neptunicella marina]|uniref:Beta-lactamase family protein n=1 Tax=Neptunicella marina TaxID=2125989 RepID=A0A8J6LYV8_9ALTE|nr:serine hydrolase domain-containing protein [Neptunicella marina]MBC3766329.1 beta-lactamase family protein [Neptunicella marina]